MNLAFEKRVFVRYTTNGWQSYLDVNAKHQVKLQTRKSQKFLWKTSLFWKSCFYFSRAQVAFRTRSRSSWICLKSTRGYFLKIKFLFYKKRMLIYYRKMIKFSNSKNIDFFVSPPLWSSASATLRTARSIGTRTRARTIASRWSTRAGWVAQSAAVVPTSTNNPLIGGDVFAASQALKFWAQSSVNTWQREERDNY